MTWTAPITFVAGTGLTANDLNTYLRDNFNETAPAKAESIGGWFMVSDLNQIQERRVHADFNIHTARTTTTSPYVDLTGTYGHGPEVTIECGTTALVILSAQFWNNTVGGQCLMSHQVTDASGSLGVTTATDNAALMGESATASQAMAGSHWVIRNGITPGMNTFTAKYRVNTGTGTWIRRRIMVLPL